ncbi:uncharacterized protein LOC107365474 [Tetranychus urticae]|uniref:tRNA-splicing endonuclease subunit Sen54 N-terminal domain-containing protein n=1 Tax=Tetranychus urticae TaxID=32264 RepID=T1JPT7_TETUR|nr:uncharacterized protein LOC107365474 [Tetranychus urticae]
MDTSVLLSGEQLLLLKLNYKTKKKMRPRQNSFSTKIVNLPNNSAEMDSLANRVQTELNNKFAILKEPRVRSASEMGLAVWCPQTKSAVVICDKKRQPWMGYTENNQLRYTPEETLFLMETESIIVNYMELPLSLQTAYQLILTDEYLFKCYKVYAYLTRLGYKLKPFPQSDQARSLAPNISSTTFITNKTVEPIIKSNCALRLVMMPLRRDMFLRGTSFDRCANWAEYKRSTTPREPGVIFAEEATVLELNEEIRNERNIFDQLPNKSLIDYSKNLQPLIDQTKVTDINRLHQIFKEAGPQEKCLNSRLPSSSDVALKYQVYTSSRKNFSSNDLDYCLTISDETDCPPTVNDLIHLDEKCGKSQLIFAITSQQDFNFYTLQPFECWDEMPALWDSNRV